MKPLVYVGVALVSASLLLPNTTLYAQEWGEKSAEYWQQKKVEDQKKNSEMRQKKYEELTAKGYDVTNLPEGILDASKTDEGKFWNWVKSVTAVREREERVKMVAKLKEQGKDVSVFTEEILDPLKTDGGKFWDLVKKVSGEKVWEPKKEEKPRGGVMTPPVQIRGLTDSERKYFTEAVAKLAPEKLPLLKESIKKRLSVSKNERARKKLYEMYAIVEIRIQELADEDDTSVEDVLRDVQ